MCKYTMIFVVDDVMNFHYNKINNIMPPPKAIL